MQRLILIIFCVISIRANSQVVIISGDLGRAADLIDNRIVYDNKLGWRIDCKKLENIIISDLNRFRRKNNLNRLKISERCDSVAREQTRYMERTGNFSHERDSLDFTQRIRLVIGRGHFGENLFHETTPAPLNIYKENYENLKSKYPGFNFMWEADRVTYTMLASEIIKKWIDSPSHYKNLINPLWNYFSVSSVSTGKEIYVTLVFEE
jgi:uncharacterized protein YkwD